jgi:aldose 1-epimerase
MPIWVICGAMRIGSRSTAAAVFVSLESDEARSQDAARVTSRLEFWRYPELMAQFPFAHAVEMTYKLVDGTLEVETLLENQSSDPMPVGVGYHPYFQVPDIARDQCKVHVAAREHLELSPLLIPTGERTPVTYPDPVSLATTQLDDVFSHLVRGKDGRAVFWVEGGGKKFRWYTARSTRWR